MLQDGAQPHDTPNSLCGRFLTRPLITAGLIGMMYSVCMLLSTDGKNKQMLAMGLCKINWLCHKVSIPVGPVAPACQHMQTAASQS
jgi:signal transduction protein with GAF and PtsI domain